MKSLNPEKNQRIKLEKAKFREELKYIFDKKIDLIYRAWSEYQKRIQNNINEVDELYEKNRISINDKIDSIKNKSIDVNSEVDFLKTRIEQLKIEKNKHSSKSNRKKTEKVAEIDLEIKLQSNVVDLHRKLEEKKREILRAKDKKLKYKKMYIRAIEEYEKIKKEEEDRYNKRIALQRKKYLIEKEKEKEIKKIKEEDKKNNPSGRYLSLLAAAGHSNIENVPVSIESPDTPDIPKKEMIVCHPNYEELSIIEKNIRTLLSTGNYHENDPVIRGLYAKIQNA